MCVYFLTKEETSKQIELFVIAGCEITFKRVIHLEDQSEIYSSLMLHFLLHIFSLFSINVKSRYTVAASWLFVEKSVV